MKKNENSGYLKNVKVQYLKCQQGQLHEGQIMNFICIDSQCKEKGLICPICQTTSHQGHQTMHLKNFLLKIDTIINPNEDIDLQEQMGSLADHLRSIQKSKKEIIKCLKNVVNQLAQKIHEVQDKIQNNYLTIRKIILSQSNLTTKLPQLYKILTQSPTNNNNNNKNQQIIQQISKYAQLLQYKNNKIYTIDNLKTIVNQYSINSNSLTIHLQAIISEIDKNFYKLPIKINKFTHAEQQNLDKFQFIFSKNQKAQGIQLQKNEKQAIINGENMGGIVFTNPILDGSDKQKISFKIQSCVSDSISLGISIPEVQQSKKYLMDESDNAELYGICSMGIVLNDFDNQSFVFSQGDIIEIIWDPLQTKLIFSRRNGIQKFQLILPISNLNAQKMSFFALLVVPGDKVTIVS